VENTMTALPTPDQTAMTPAERNKRAREERKTDEQVAAESKAASLVGDERYAIAADNLARSVGHLYSLCLGTIEVERGAPKEVIVLDEDDGDGTKKKKKKKPTYLVQICSAFDFIGSGSTGKKSFKVIDVRNTQHRADRDPLSKKWQRVSITMSELSNPTVLVQRLRDLGMLVYNQNELMNLLAMLTSRDSDNAPSGGFEPLVNTGWRELHDGSKVFAMPDQSVLTTNGAVGADVMPMYDVISDGYETGGTLEGANNLLRVIEDEPFIVSAVGVTLSAHLVQEFGLGEPGIYHLFATSSAGKGTAASVAASMFGKGAPDKDGGVIRSWNGTEFGHENVFALLHDQPMVMDEQKLVASDAMQRLAYALSNGSGKIAGNGDGRKNREMITFRSPILSTGERSFKDHIELDKSLRMDAGASLRVLDIPLVSFAGNYPQKGFATDADHADFCLKSKDGSSGNYGFHFRLAVQTYLDTPDAKLEIQTIRDRIEALYPEKQNQIVRVWRRFTLIAANLEWLISKGVLPWAAGVGESAVMSVFFKAWKDNRGGDENASAEANAGIERLLGGFMEKRASLVNPDKPEIIIQNRLGFEYNGCVWATKAVCMRLIGDANLLTPTLKYLKTGKNPLWGLKCDEGELTTRAPAKFNGEIGNRVYCFVMKAAPADPVEALQKHSYKLELDKVRAELAASRAEVYKLTQVIETATVNSRRKHFYKPLGALGKACSVRPLKGTRKKWTDAREGNPTIGEYEQTLAALAPETATAH
jgi:hypothetical protein